MKHAGVTLDFRFVLDDPAAMQGPLKSKAGRTDTSRRREGARPLERYVQILEALVASREGLSATQIAQTLGLPKSAVTRLLAGLAESELVEGGGGRGLLYRPGRRLRRLVQLGADEAWVGVAVRVPLRHLAERTGETCFVAQLFDTEVRSVAMEAPDARVGVYVVPGHELMPHATASGKAIMAFQDKATVDAALARKLPRYTLSTEVKAAAIRREYEQVRRQGYAVEIGEHVEGLATVACPIRLPDVGVLYSVGVTGPSDRVRARIKDGLVPLMQSIATDLARALGGRGD